MNLIILIYFFGYKRQTPTWRIWKNKKTRPRKDLLSDNHQRSPTKPSTRDNFQTSKPINLAVTPNPTMFLVPTNLEVVTSTEDPSSTPSLDKAIKKGLSWRHVNLDTLNKPNASHLIVHIEFIPYDIFKLILVSLDMVEDLVIPFNPKRP
jgi:hypothetical protein